MNKKIIKDRWSSLGLYIICYAMIVCIIILLRLKNLSSIKISVEYLSISIMLMIGLLLTLHLKKKIISYMIFYIWLVNNLYGLCELLLNRNDISNLWPFSIKYFVGIGLWIIVWLIIYLFVGRVTKTIWIASILQIFLSIINYYVTVFRGSGIGFQDIFAINTVTTVFRNYHFFVDFLILSCLTIWILIMLMAKKVVEAINTLGELNKRKVFVMNSIGIFLLLMGYYVGICAKIDIYPQYYRNSNGVLLNFLVQSLDNLKNENSIIYVEPNIDKDKYHSDELVVKEYPNIICIMNESFTDLRVLGNLETDVDVLPTLDSLHENTIKGYVYSSVWGGGTADSEYEFLTGDSTIAYSIYPYAQIDKTNQLNFLPGQLKQLGYYTVAMHAFNQNGWRRNIVYDAMRFDKKLFIQDFSDLEFIHGNGKFASDESQYNKIYELLSTSQEPVFIFDVTIQNHGGYETGVEIQENRTEIKIKNLDKEFNEAENFIQLMHESDKAFGELIEQLKKIDKPVVVCMFGDHQPKLSEEFYESVFKNDFDDLTDSQKMRLYMTPYIIWANFDLKKSQDHNMSINYLSTYLLEQTGMPLTAYNKYLKDLYKEYPVITATGILDKNGKLFAPNEAPEDIQEYKNLIYSHWKNKKLDMSDWFLYKNK